MYDKNVNYTKTQERSIYVLISKTKKCFLVYHCRTSSLRETYRHILAGERCFSKKFFEKIGNERPCIFELERLNTTVSKAYNHILVWIKIFIENGFESCNYDTTIEYSDYLYTKNKNIYENFKGTDIEQLLSCKNCNVPTYKNKTCECYDELNANKESILTQKVKRKRSKEVRIKVNEYEYQSIVNNAKKLKMQTNNYIRKALKGNKIFIYNEEIVAKHSAEIICLRRLINDIIFIIDASNNYIPKVIGYCADAIQELFSLEKKLLRLLLKLKKNEDEIYKFLL